MIRGAAVCLGILCGAVGNAAPGARDATFQVGGGPNDSVRTIAALPDGKSLIAGSFTAYDGAPCGRVARLMPDGARDASFDAGTGPDVHLGVEAFPLRDGKVLVAGAFTRFSEVARPMLVRLLANGAVDAAFDAEIELGPLYSDVTKVAVQADGRIVIAGRFLRRGEEVDRTVDRLFADGRVDRSFDAQLSAPGFTGLEVLPDGRILVAGFNLQPPGVAASGMVRLRRDGTHDPTFCLDRVDYVRSFTALPDGRMLIAASQGVYRLLPGGAFDPTFALSSFLTAGIYRKLALQPDGAIIAAGSHLGMVRLLRDGTHDGTFVGDVAATPELKTLALDVAGRVVVAADSITGNVLARVLGGAAPLPGAGTLRMAWPVYAAPEAAGSLTVAVVREGGNAGTVSVAYAVTGGTAGAGDFGALGDTLVFAPGETVHTITIPIFDDTLTEPDETVLVTLHSPTGGATLGFESTATATIVDDDRPGVIEWRVSAIETTEGAGEIELTATRNGHTVGSVAVDFTPTSGTATEGVDYAAARGTLTLADGENVKTVRVPIFDDGLREGSETFTVTLSSPTGGATLGAATMAVVTIRDNDSAGSRDPGFAPTGSLDDIYGSIAAAVELPDGRVIVGGRFTRYGGLVRHSLVRLLADGTPDETFDAQFPLPGSPGGLPFVPGLVQFPLTARVAQIVAQPDGRLLVVASGLRSYQQELTRLLPDGARDPSFAPASIGDSVQKMALQLDGRVLVVSSLFAPGSNTQTTLARLRADGSLDPTFTCAITGFIEALAVQPDGRVVVGGGSLRLGDRVLPGVARLHPGGEFDASFVTDARLNENVCTAHALALEPDGRLLAAGEFTLRAGGTRALVRFAPDGQLDRSFDAAALPVVNALPLASLFLERDGAIVTGAAGLLRLRADGTVDPAYEVRGYSPSGVLTLLRSGATLVATSDSTALLRVRGGPLDLPGAGTASFVWAGHHVSEAGGSARLEVVRRGGTAGTLTVDYYTLDREAREGVDYTARSGTLTFGPGEVLHEIEIPIADNATIEGARSFYVVLGAEPAAGLRPSVIVTIEDDARPGHLAWETEPAAVREGAGAITLKVRRTLGTEGRSTVQFETADGSAKAGADFAATTGTLIFEDGVTEQTVAIPIATDGVNEGDEVFFISLGGGAGGASLDPVPSALVTIYDIDDPGSFAGTAGLGVNPHIDALVAQRDGKVVVAGTFTVAPGTVDAPHAVVRLNADGQLDPTFTIFHYAGFAQSMAVYTDGTLILAGQSLTLERASFVRLASDGTLDAAFHPPTPGPNGPVYGVGAQPDGRIVFAGVFGTVGGVPRRFLARLLADGTLDPTFQPTVASGIRKMIVAPDGSIYHGAPNTRVAHLRADGTADPAWEMPTIPTSAANQPTCLQLDADGRLLVGGSFEGVNGVPRASLVRLLPTGRVDPTFKPSAVLTSAVEAIALQADGGILAAFFDYRSRGGLLRLEPTGAHDPTFDLPPGQPNGQGRFTALAVLPAAGLLVGGDFFEIDRVAQEDTALLLLGPQRGAFRFPPGTGDLVREGTTSFAVSVQRIGSTQGRASVRYETLPGKALSGEDFTPVSGTLTFEDGESAHTIPIAITDDFAYEQAEAFSVQLSEAEGAQLWPSDRTRFVTIQDNDLPQRGVLHFSTDAITVSEDAGVVRLRIERSHGSDGDATVSLAIAPRTGKNVAAAGSDFSLTTAAVTFLDGQTSRAFDIPISRDGKFEPAEQFVITLSPPAFPPMLELPPTVTVTILDGDQPAIEATRGRYRALVESPTGSWNSSGLVDFTVGARGAVTGTLALEGRRWSWRGELDARRRLELLLPRAGQEPLILQLDVDLTDPEHPRITGSVDHDFVSSTFDAARQTFHAARNPAPAAGRYTLAFAPGTGDHAPAGHGFALVSVNKGGRVWMSGKLGDGTPFTHGSMLGHDGGWAIFLPLSTRRGTFRGEVRLSAALPWDVAGEATWYKPASATDFGWDTPIVIAGSALPATAPLFPAAAAVQVTLTGGGLPQPVVSAPLARPRATTLTGPLALTLTLQPATGLFTGRFQHPATQRSTRVQGVILSDENRGAGCFSGPASAGAVELQTAPAP